MALSPKNQAARSACGASGGTADELVDASLQGLGGAVVGHGHEDRVVAADRAEDAVEARSVDGESHRLGVPRAGLDDDETPAGDGGEDVLVDRGLEAVEGGEARD